MLVLSHIHKNFKVGEEEIKVLKNVTLSVQQGEFVAILGPSGCGKTTLLNLIAGMDKTSEGTISFDGKNLQGFKDKDWAIWRRRGVGYIFQQFNLLEYMTAQQNVEMVLKLNGVGKGEQHKKSKQLLELVGLEKRGKHLPSQLSGGQKQRVAIARAMANNPSILLADEPTGAMDSQTAGEILELLKKINREKNVTVIMVTHDEKMAAQADRKISMLDGKIVEDVVIQKTLERKEKREDIAVSPIKHFFVSMAYKNLLKRKKRTFLTSFATAIGIAGVLVAFGIGFGVKGRIIKEVGSIVNSQVVDVTETNVKMDAECIKEILEYEDVLDVYPNNRSEAACVYNGNVSSGMMRVISPVEHSIPFWVDNLEYGELPSSNDSNEAVITLTMAKKLVGQSGDIEGLLGKELDMIFVADAKESIPKQAGRKIKVVGIAGDSFMGVEYISIPYLLAEEVVRESLQDANYKSSTYCVTVKSAEAAKRVKDLLSDRGFKATLDEEALGTIGTVIDMVIAIIMLIAGIALVVAGIMIALVTYIGVVERTREIGILRAIGFSAKNILTMFLVEGSLIGLFAGMIGVLLASGIGNLVNFVAKTVYEGIGFELYQVDLNHILICLSFSMLIGLFCAHSPARKAAKMEPVKALGYVQ